MNRIILQYKNQIFFSIVALFSLLGIYVGYITVDKYDDIVIQGILGIAVHYLSYRYYLSPKNTENRPLGIKLELPRDYKLFTHGFVLSVVLFWAGIYALRLMQYLLRILLA